MWFVYFEGVPSKVPVSPHGTLDVSFPRYSESSSGPRFDAQATPYFIFLSERSPLRAFSLKCEEIKRTREKALGDTHEQS